MIGEFLRQVTTALDTNEIPYMLTGSIASSMYGVPRATNDIDIVVAPNRQQLLSLVQLFKRLGLTVEPNIALQALKTRNMFNVIDFQRGLKVDLIVRKERDFSVMEFDRRETHEVEGMRLTIATPEDVLLAKLEWAKIGESEIQLRDVAGILRVQGKNLDWAYIEHWVRVLELGVQWRSAQDVAAG
jgi:hypothetical protein